MTGDAGGFAQTTIEIDAAEAANGTTKVVWTPQHGQVTVTVPPGTGDGVVTWAQGPAGPVSVTLRIRQTTDPQQWGPPPAPTQGYPEPQPGFVPPPGQGYPQPGFAGQPGYAGQPGFSGQPGPQPGFSGQPGPQPGFSGQPGPQSGPGYPQPGYPPQPGFPGQGGYPALPPPPPPTKPRKGLLIGIGSAVAVVLIAGCCIGTRLIAKGDDKTDSSAQPGGSTATAPAKVTPVTPVEYSQLLTDADAAIKTDFAKLNTASKTTLKTAAPAAAEAMRDQAQKLLSVTPPTAAATANADLATQLQSWADSLATDATAASSCIATPGPYADLLKSQFATEIRVDAKELATADPTFKFGSFLPAAPKEKNRRLATGTYLKRPSNRGLGHLEIQNGAGDTTISLVPTGSKKATLTVYVRSKGKFTATGVRDGSYKVYSATGTDYDSAKKGFTRGCGFTKFDDTFKFTTTSTSSTIWQIKLTPVVGGNASTTDVDPGSFPTN